MSEPLLAIESLSVDFGTPRAPFLAVDDFSLEVRRGEVVGIVGESGSGKSVSMLAVLGLVDAPGRISASRIAFGGTDLLGLSSRARRGRLRGRIGMIFQDPVASLDPSYTVGAQIVETLRAQHGLSASAARDRAGELFAMVEIPDPASRLEAYPFQLSGGLCQRVMIALALAGEPELLIADEPTTALDVTIQAQILALLARLQAERGMALVLITHDLAVLVHTAQRVAVMYAGQLVEIARVDEIFAQPRHPYTRALLASIPERSRGARRLPSLAGTVPGRGARPPGCLLAPRCPRVEADCTGTKPALEAGVRCLHPHEVTP